MAPTSRGPSAISTLVVRLCYLLLLFLSLSLSPSPSYSLSFFLSIFSFCILSLFPSYSFLSFYITRQSLSLSSSLSSLSLLLRSLRSSCVVRAPTCGMIVCDAECSGTPHQRFVFVMADATCRRRDASSYRDTR